LISCSVCIFFDWGCWTACLTGKKRSETRIPLPKKFFLIVFWSFVFGTLLFIFYFYVLTKKRVKRSFLVWIARPILIRNKPFFSPIMNPIEEEEPSLPDDNGLDTKTNLTTADTPPHATAGVSETQPDPDDRICPNCHQPMRDHRISLGIDEKIPRENDLSEEEDEEEGNSSSAGEEDDFDVEYRLQDGKDRKWSPTKFMRRLEENVHALSETFREPSILASDSEDLPELVSDHEGSSPPLPDVSTNMESTEGAKTSPPQPLQVTFELQTLSLNASVSIPTKDSEVPLPIPSSLEATLEKTETDLPLAT
jgi:hypothetical protein